MTLRQTPFVAHIFHFNAHSNANIWLIFLGQHSPPYWSQNLHHNSINLLISKLFTWLPIYLRFVLEVLKGFSARRILIAYDSWLSRITKREAHGGCPIARLLSDLTTATRGWFIGLFLLKNFIPHFLLNLIFFLFLYYFLALAVLINFSCSRICACTTLTFESYFYWNFPFSKNNIKFSSLFGVLNFYFMVLEWKFSSIFREEKFFQFVFVDLYHCIRTPWRVWSCKWVSLTFFN
jgi:hypothetical protein